VARKWRPFRRMSRRRLKADRCGTRCYLSPRKLKYPVCKRSSCKPSCQGTRAAFMRARQQHDSKVSKKAVRLGKRLGCGWARGH
jgi:hypothetical protein